MKEYDKIKMANHKKRFAKMHKQQKSAKGLQNIIDMVIFMMGLYGIIVPGAANLGGGKIICGALVIFAIADFRDWFTPPRKCCGSVHGHRPGCDGS